MASNIKQKLADWLKEYWPFFLPPMIILPGLADFAFPGNTAEYSDIVLTHYPNAIFLKRSLLTEGILPMWSPNILSGYPFIAHPHSGIWYPPMWLVLLIPLPLGLNLMVAAHLVLAGIALYTFLRLKGLSRHAALLGGLAFEATPKIFAHFGAGQILLICAVCLTPLLFWASLRQSGKSKLWSRILQPGPLLALIFFLDPRWAFYSGAAWAIWFISHSHRRKIVGTFLLMLKHFLISALIVFPMLWAFLEFSSLSTRANLSPNEVLELSLPTGSLLGFAIPQWGGPHEWLLYPGILVLAFSIFSLFTRERKSKLGSWLALAGFTVILSLGENFPGMQALAGLPGFSLLRVPPRALFLTLMALSVLSAVGFEALEELVSRNDLRPLRLTMLALTSFLTILAVMFYFQHVGSWLPALWAALILATLWFVVEKRATSNILPKPFFLLIACLMLIDLTLMAQSVISFRPVETVLNQDKELTRFISDQQGQIRVYSPSYSLGQQSAVLNQIEQADGVDPIQLQTYADFFEEASGIPSTGYTSTQPPFASGHPNSANRTYQPDAAKLGLLNVAFVLSEFPLDSEGLVFRERLDGTFVYANELVKERAWLQAPDGTEGAAEVLEWEPNRIRLRAVGPGTLVLSEIYYPGWQVWIDHQPGKILAYEGILRSLNLADGEHIVELRFLPQPIIWGLPISIITILTLVFWPSQKEGDR